MTASTPPGRRTRTTALAVTGLALAGLLAACGGGDATTASPSASGPTGSPGAGGGRPGEFAGMDMQAVSACLEAAGVSMPAFPTRSFSGSDRPTFSRDPSFTGRPPGGTAMPGRGQGSGGFLLNDPQVKAALEACGISVPTFTPRSRPSQPTASPSL